LPARWGHPLGLARRLDDSGNPRTNAAVPKSGQLWDARFLERSALLRELGDMAQPLLGGSSWPTLEEYSALAERERQARASELSAVRFAPPSPRIRSQPVELGQLYDGRIALHGEVPCVGSSYHDFLNALVWAAFPRAKRALHARQYRALEAWLPPASAQLPNRRTREQDALALFDEGGAVLVLTPELAAHLRTPRAAAFELGTASDARVVLFGHAVMEHVCFESRSVSSATLALSLEPPLPRGRPLLELVDRALAARLANPSELREPAFDHVLSIQPPDLASV
jgi:hypothetical protein